jgi:predicted pyridoxine 5'-phosphate oxidase superfamily flavin-nucleotide-binding protein
MDSGQSGSAGEGDLQERFGTKRRALSFYENSMHDRLNEVMQRFVAERIMFFLGTADAEGHTDCSPRFGPRGFVTVLDDTRLAYPECPR